MPNLKQLPYLLKLVDDDSGTVRRAVLKELAGFGPDLEREVSRLAPAFDKSHLKELLEDYRRTVLKDEWSGWQSLPGFYERLEAAFSLLTTFQNGMSHPLGLKEALDAVAAEYSARHGKSDVYALAVFLFREKGLSGADSDYYNPTNSNLVHVIETKRGIPISLTCIYMLVGHRLGLEIGGCNFPGHFLARTVIEGEIFLVDCFNGGQFLREESLSMNDVAEGVREMIRSGADVETIVARVLHNLIRAYEQSGYPENMQLMTDLLEAVENFKGGWKPEGE